MSEANTTHQLRELVEAQGRDGTWNYDPYMQGMFNGMELALAVIEQREPAFRRAPEQWLYELPRPTGVEAVAQTEKPTGA